MLEINDGMNNPTTVELQYLKGGNTPTTTHSPEEERLGLCDVENLGPRGPIGKIFKIKRH